MCQYRDSDGRNKSWHRKANRSRSLNVTQGADGGGKVLTRSHGRPSIMIPEAPIIRIIGDLSCITIPVAKQRRDQYSTSQAISLWQRGASELAPETRAD